MKFRTFSCIVQRAVDVRTVAAVIIALFAVFFGVRTADAATTFSLEGPSKAAVNEPVTVELTVTSDQILNAYNILLNFNTNELDLESVDTSGSLIDIWPHPPTVFTSGIVKWNGASIKPWSGVRGELLKLHLRPHAGVTSTIVEFSMGNAAYLGNGKGTKVIPALKPLTLAFEKRPVAATSTTPVPDETGASEPSAPVDITEPDISYIEMGHDPINHDQKLLTFLVKDTGSGVKSVEARSRSWFLWSDWQIIHNPTAYPLGVYEAQIRVTDNAQNVAGATVVDRQTALEKIALFVGFASVVFITLRVRLRIRSRKRR